MHSDFSIEYIIDNWFGFLFENGEFIKESNTNNYRGDSICIVSSDRIKLKFINERSQNFLDIASIHRPKDYEDIHLVKYLLINEGYDEGLLNEIDAYFIKEYKSQIEDLFSKRNIDDTLKKIKDIRVKRADEWWPNE